MIELVTRLSEDQLDALAGLERQVVAADGGRLKLEWETLGSRGGERVDDVLWWRGGELAGFLGVYDFGSPVELSGMVAPGLRRQGIGAALLDAALGLCAERGATAALLVVPRTSDGGRALAASRGGALHHSEHALALTAEPAGTVTDPHLRVRAAVTDDADAVARLLSEGFAHVSSDVAAQIAAHPGRTLVVELDGEVVGTLRLDREQGQAGVYGFVVQSDLRGRGIGRQVLRQVCRAAWGDGVRRIGLEVAVDNEHALGLYTSLGFEPVTTEDYYELATR